MGECRQGKKQTRRKAIREKQQSTSIYFLLWSAFTAFSLIIVLLLSISQGVLLTRTYRSEAAVQLREKGKQIQRLVTIQTLPPEYEDNRNAYVNMLSAQFGVQIFVLNEQGDVLYPQLPDTDEGGLDFSDEIAQLKNALQKQGVESVVYESGTRFVYGAKIELYEAQSYLYVENSVEISQAATRQMGVRIILSAVFVFVLSFAISSAVSAWLTKPINEMIDKTALLANGDFSVDFHGSDYGQEMVDLAEALNFARDELSKTDAMQKQIIANVSHDFKTPLTMIKAYASMIVEISGDNKAKRDKHAQIIIDETDRLTLLVNDVLSLSKMNAGIETLQETAVDMSAYVLEILGRFDYLKETQGYQFTVDVEDGLYTRGDELKLGQVLYNLIGNAVNYTGEDKRVFVSLRRTDDSAFRFSVRDTGAGIKQEELPTIWARYYRSSETHKRPVQGTGLGLSIVKTVLDRHGFTYAVESEEGQGSLFYVDFPLYNA